MSGTAGAAARGPGTRKPPPGRGFREAAGQGFEPQLPDPESGVLPLDDPATAYPGDYLHAARRASAREATVDQPNDVEAMFVWNMRSSPEPAFGAAEPPVACASAAWSSGDI